MPAPNPLRRIPAALAGLWLDGYHGHAYSTARVIEQAIDYGFRLQPHEIGLLREYKRNSRKGTEAVEQLAGLATLHLQRLAPDGHAFYWDGDSLILATRRAIAAEMGKRRKESVWVG